MVNSPLVFHLLLRCVHVDTHRCMCTAVLRRSVIALRLRRVGQFSCTAAKGPCFFSSAADQATETGNTAAGAASTLHIVHILFNLGGLFIRSVSGTGNRHPIPTDRVPAVAMFGWHVARHWPASDGDRAAAQ